MECNSCKAELEGTSRFCPKCGEKTEDQSEDLDRVYSKASGCWFLLGMAYGTMKAKKDKEGIKKFEAHLKRYNFYEEYFKALTFAKNHGSKSKLNGEGQITKGTKAQ